MTVTHRPAPRLVLVVPCYNEARRLRGDAFLEFVRTVPDCAVLFVDDGSTDETSQLLGDLAAAEPRRFESVALDRNVGKAEAVRQGMLAAIGKRPAVVGYWDADLSTPLDAVRELLAILEGRPDVDIVMGSRVKLLGRMVDRDPLRHYVGRVFATLASLTLGLAVYDTQCGAKLFRVRDVVTGVFERPFSSRWAFDVEILARYVQAVGRAAAASRICELPLQVWSDVPGSKVRVTHGPRAALDLLRIWISTR